MVISASPATRVRRRNNAAPAPEPRGIQAQSQQHQQGIAQPQARVFQGSRRQRDRQSHPPALAASEAKAHAPSGAPAPGAPATQAVAQGPTQWVQARSPAQAHSLRRLLGCVDHRTQHQRVVRRQHAPPPRPGETPGRPGEMRARTNGLQRSSCRVNCNPARGVGT